MDKPRLNIPVNEVLETAISENLTEVIVIAKDRQGKWYINTSHSNMERINFALDIVKHRLIGYMDESE